MHIQHNHQSAFYSLAISKSPIALALWIIFFCSHLATYHITQTTVNGLVFQHLFLSHTCYLVHVICMYFSISQRNMQKHGLCIQTENHTMMYLFIIFDSPFLFVFPVGIFFSFKLVAVIFHLYQNFYILQMHCCSCATYTEYFLSISMFFVCY